MKKFEISVLILALFILLCSCSSGGNEDVKPAIPLTYATEAGEQSNIFESSEKITVDGKTYIRLTEDNLKKAGYFNQEHSRFTASGSYKAIVPYFEPKSEKFGFLADNGKVVTDPIYDAIESRKYSWVCITDDIYSLSAESENEYHILLDSDKKEYDTVKISKAGNIAFEEHISEDDSGISYEFNKNGYFVNEFTYESPDLCKVTMFDYSGNKLFSTNGFYSGYDKDFDDFGYLAIYPCKSHLDANELYVIDKSGSRVLKNEQIIEYKNNMAIIINSTHTGTRLADTNGKEFLPYGFNGYNFMRFGEEDNTIELFGGELVEQDGGYTADYASAARCDYNGSIIEADG